MLEKFTPNWGKGKLYPKSTCFHTEVDVSLGATLKTLGKSKGSRYTLPAQIEKYVKVDDESFLQVIGSAKKRRYSELINERKKWKAVIYTYLNDKSIAGPVIEAAKNQFDSSMIAIGERSKPFRKEELLKLPVIAKNILGQRYAAELKSISDLITHFNSTYYYLALHVDPSVEKQVKRWLDNFLLKGNEKELSNRSKIAKHNKQQSRAKKKSTKKTTAKKSRRKIS